MVQISSFEQQLSTFCLPHNEVVSELLTIMKSSKELIHSIQDFVKEGIHSFSDQRAYHLACKRASYVTPSWVDKCRLT